MTLKETRCQICKKDILQDAVKHYVQMHPGYEVYCSRLSPETAKHVRNEKPWLKKYDGAYIHAFCVFCQSKKVNI